MLFVCRRRKNLLHARDLAKKRIDYENSLLLDRLQRTGPSIVDTKTLLKEYHHNNRVKRTMCKLEVGYDIAKRMQQQADKVGILYHALLQSSFRVLMTHIELCNKAKETT